MRREQLRGANLNGRRMRGGCCRNQGGGLCAICNLLRCHENPCRLSAYPIGKRREATGYANMRKCEARARVAKLEPHDVYGHVAVRGGVVSKLAILIFTPTFYGPGGHHCTRMVAASCNA
jgi:hypothetical protein